MANRVKEVSAFDGTSWGAAVPLGADDSNVDITSSTTQPDGSAVSGVSGDSATALNTSAVTVSEGDTSASAWTKFNRFRKRVANNFANYIQGSIATSYNATGSDSAVYSTNVLNNYMANVIGYSGTTAPSAGTVAAQLSSLNDNKLPYKIIYGMTANTQDSLIATLNLATSQSLIPTGVSVLRLGNTSANLYRTLIICINNSNTVMQAFSISAYSAINNIFLSYASGSWVVQQYDGMRFASIQLGSSTIESKNYKRFQKTATSITGYRPMGIVGISGIGTSYIMTYYINTTNDQINLDIYNYSNSTITQNPSVTILYTKE